LRTRPFCRWRATLASAVRETFFNDIAPLPTGSREPQAGAATTFLGRTPIAGNFRRAPSSNDPMARWSWLALLAAPLSFAAGAAGWGGARSQVESDAHAATIASPVAAAAPAATCIDPAAMDANQNLVGQVREANARLASAAAEAHKVSLTLAARDRDVPSELGTPGSEWPRMGREGFLRLRSPCVSMSGPSRVTMRGPRSGSLRTHPSDASARARIAGLSAEEVNAVDELYVREHAALWAKLKDACAALAPPSEEAESHDSRESREQEAERERHVTDYQRIAECRDLAGTGLTKATVSEVAELRAAGVVPRASESPRVKVLFVLAGGGEDLSRDLVLLLGRDKAARVLAYGAYCIDEAFLRGAAPDAS
jgi:hypothetical protein